jgi:hypothetical protein
MEPMPNSLEAALVPALTLDDTSTQTGSGVRSGFDATQSVMDDDRGLYSPEIRTNNSGQSGMGGHQGFQGATLSGSPEVSRRKDKPVPWKVSQYVKDASGQAPIALPMSRHDSSAGIEAMDLDPDDVGPRCADRYRKLETGVIAMERTIESGRSDFTPSPQDRPRPPPTHPHQRSSNNHKMGNRSENSRGSNRKSGIDPNGQHQQPWSEFTPVSTNSMMGQHGSSSRIFSDSSPKSLSSPPKSYAAVVQQHHQAPKRTAPTYSSPHNARTPVGPGRNSPNRASGEATLRDGSHGLSQALNTQAALPLPSEKGRLAESPANLSRNDERTYAQVLASPKPLFSTIRRGASPQPPAQRVPPAQDNHGQPSAHTSQACNDQSMCIEHSRPATLSSYPPFVVINGAIRGCERPLSEPQQAEVEADLVRSRYQRIPGHISLWQFPGSTPPPTLFMTWPHLVSASTQTSTPGQCQDTPSTSAHDLPDGSFVDEAFWSSLLDMEPGDNDNSLSGSMMSL